MPGATKTPLSARPSHTRTWDPAGIAGFVMVRKSAAEFLFLNSALSVAVHAGFAVLTVTRNSWPAKGKGAEAGLNSNGVIVRPERRGASPYANTTFFGQISPRRKTIRRGYCEMSVPSGVVPYQTTSCGP